MRYRKKPVVIEAVQWQPNLPGVAIHDCIGEPCPPWLRNAINKDPDQDGSVTRYGDNLFIKTLEGKMCASPGDWIIQGVNGEIYFCKPDIFERTYEPA